MTDQIAENVTLWLSVDWVGNHGKSELYVRTVHMDFLPHEGDTILYLLNEQDPNDGVAGYVKRRWWSNTGRANVELQRIVVDPASYMPQTPHRYDTYWWTSQDGDVEPYIERSGWKRYTRDGGETE